MNRRWSMPFLIALLLPVSILLYLAQIILYNRPSETAFYLLQDLAFVPISVLLVSLGLNTILNRRDRQAKIEKVSIVISEFFSEAGTELIIALSPFITRLDDVSPGLRPDSSWKEQNFDDAAAMLNRIQLAIDIRRGNPAELLRVMRKSKEHILRLFENANLLEHDRFTDMLWAVYHVYDELHSRSSLADLPVTDIRHLEKDIQRAAHLLFTEWIDYMRLLKKRYPYLFSLAARKCPFAGNDVIIRD